MNGNDFIFDFSYVKAFPRKKEGEDDSLASLENLAKFPFPDRLNLEENVDLLPVVMDGVVINVMNANHDAIATEEALKIAHLFKEKPLNIEHQKQKIVGHIVDYGWSSFVEENKLLKEEDIKESKEPFNLVIAGVVYITSAPEFASVLVETNDKESEYYKAVGSSWEVAISGLEDFDVIIGSKNVSECEIVSDMDEKEYYKKYLKKYGGKGFLPDGRIIGRLIRKGLPRAFGFTTNPAASVEGVATPGFIEEEDIENENSQAKDENDNSQIQENKTDSIVEEKNKEEIEKNSVIATEQKNFKKIQMKDIKDILASLPEENSAKAKQIIEDAIASAGLDVTKKSQEIQLKYEAMIKEKEDADKKVQDSVSQIQELNEKIENLANALNASNQQTESLQNQILASKQAGELSERLQVLTSEFNLTENQVEIVTKQIKGLDETAYATWYQEFGAFGDSLKKQKEKPAVTETDPLDDATASKDTLSGASLEDLKNGFGKLFTIEKK